MKFVATILALAFHVAVVLGDGPFGFMSEFYDRVEAPLNNLQNQLRSRFVPTLWCGVRNAAPIPDALSAVYPHLDNCCREHDQVRLCGKEKNVKVVSLKFDFSARWSLKEVSASRAFATRRFSSQFSIAIAKSSFETASSLCRRRRRFRCSPSSGRSESWPTWLE